MNGKEIKVPKQLIDAFDLFDAIVSIVEHEHVENLKALRKVIDNRIAKLQTNQNLN